MRKELKKYTKKELINIIANLRQNNTKLKKKNTDLKAIILITKRRLENITNNIENDKH